MIAAFTMVALLGFAAFAVDLGYVYVVRNRLQSATDSSALAAATDMRPGNLAARTRAALTAAAYGAAQGNKNAIPAMQSVNMDVAFDCRPNSVPLPCNNDSDESKRLANAVVVTQTARVPLFFGHLLGTPAVTVSAVAVAGAAGGDSKAMDVIIVMDATASMATSITGCGQDSLGRTISTKLHCAVAGVQSLLLNFRPSVDRVALMAYPPIKKTSATKASNCSTDMSSADYSAYRSSGVLPSTATYQIAALTSAYRTSDASSVLDGSQTLVTAVRGKSGSCTGLESPYFSGYPMTFYADAITAAKNALIAGAKPESEKVIILLSDGDATASTSVVGSNQCTQAVNAAKAATTAGVSVYSIAYEASTNSPACTTTQQCTQVKVDPTCTKKCTYTTVCQNVTQCSPNQESCQSESDSSKSACWAMQNIASKPEYFYSTGSTGCTSSAGNDYDNIKDVFDGVGVSLTKPRLLPSSAN